jgi:phosphoribosylaminoimidazole-succinocarboxamide synthase
VTHRALLETDLPGLPKRKGKVRDIYDLGDYLLLVATDRISAFDWVLPTGIPDKGRVLTGLSEFWFKTLSPTFFNNHLLSTDIDRSGLDLDPEIREALAGRSMIVEKFEVIPFECVVRGYLSGSAWKEYRSTGTVCGERLPPGLVESQRIDPMFTPATKAETGHDENVPFARMADAIGSGLAESLKDSSLRLYEDARALAHDRGLILADTKFEFGIDRILDRLVVIDEVLTPDSSRYWPKKTYKPGGPQPSFDKQFVRDWLESTGWDKASPPPPLPDDVVTKTRAKYIEAYEILTGQPFPWK